MLIGGGGFLFPFINLFYTQQGLSDTQIGLLSTPASIAALIAAPWWGRRCDATTHPRRLLQFGLLVTLLCILALSRQAVFAWMALIVTFDALLGIGVPPLSDVVALAVIKGKAGFGACACGDRLGRRHSAGSLLRVSLLSYTAVALSVVIAPTVPVILFSHVIAGVAYSFFAVASVLFIAEVAPQRQVTTMMAIFTVTLPAIVRTVSGPVSGRMFDVRGAHGLYVSGAIGAAVGWLIMKVTVKDRRVEE